MPWSAAWAPHGSPTQNRSMAPAFTLATICGGGMVMILREVASTSAALSQYRSHMSCVPPGNVMVSAR